MASWAAAAAGAEDDGRALAVEGTIRVAGVGEGAADGFEDEQLHRLDRGQTVGRHAEQQRIERHVGEESAPFRANLVARLRVGIVVEPPVPVIERHFRDGVDAAQHVLPVGSHIVGAGKETGHADDGDVGRLLRG